VIDIDATPPRIHCENPPPTFNKRIINRSKKQSSGHKRAKTEEKKDLLLSC
jgi:hypothetical protein